MDRGLGSPRAATSFSRTSLRTPPTARSSNSRVSRPLVAQTAKLRVPARSNGGTAASHSGSSGSPIRIENLATRPHRSSVARTERRFATTSGAIPMRASAARRITQRKFVYPSTRSRPGLNTRPLPSARLRA